MKKLLILTTFIITMMITTGVSWANGDYGYDCPQVECKCPDVNLSCTCPDVAKPKMAATGEDSNHKLVVSGGIRLGYHAYTANEFLNTLPELTQDDFNSPSSDQPLPPIEGEINVAIIEYFSVSALVGTYSGEHTNSLGDFSNTQTIYFMVMPRFDYSFSFELEGLPVTMNPYLGVGIGGAYFTFWHDSSVYFFPPPSAIDESHFVFAYSPSIGFDIPLIYVKPDMEDPPLGIDKSRLKLLVDYRYIGAQHKGFNAGGHLALVGLGLDF